MGRWGVGGISLRGWGEVAGLHLGFEVSVHIVHQAVGLFHLLGCEVFEWGEGVRILAAGDSLVVDAILPGREETRSTDTPLAFLLRRLFLTFVASLARLTLQIEILCRSKIHFIIPIGLCSLQ